MLQFNTLLHASSQSRLQIFTIFHFCSDMRDRCQMSILEAVHVINLSLHHVEICLNPTLSLPEAALSVADMGATYSFLWFTFLVTGTVHSGHRSNCSTADSIQKMSYWNVSEFGDEVGCICNQEICYRFSSYLLFEQVAFRQNLLTVHDRTETKINWCFIDSMHQTCPWHAC